MKNKTVLRRVNFNHLYYFKVIAQEGSIKKASAQLGLTPSSLSSQLKSLEKFLGQSLFQRRVRKLVINEAGKIVLSYANHIFNSSDELVQSLRGPQPRKIARIRVGVLPSLSKSVVNDIILPLWQDKSVCVTVSEYPFGGLLKGLSEGGVDLALADQPIVVKELNCRSRKLRHRKFVAVASPVLSKKLVNTPQDYHGSPFLHYTPHSQIREEIDLFFEQKGVSPRIVGEADDIALLKIAATSSIGFAILPLNFVETELKLRKLQVVGELGEIQSPIWTTVNASSPYSKYLSGIISDYQGKKA